MYTLDQARQLCEAAVDAMQALDVPPTPNNYQVWYAYVEGIDPSLTRAIDIMRSNRKPFTTEVCEELYQQFFGNVDDAAVFRTTEQIEQKVDQVVQLLSAAGDSASQYGAALESFGGGLKDGRADIRSLVTDILTETRRMQAQNQHLQGQLAESSSEIRDLRNDLEEVRRESRTDALTGIPNRRCFDDTLRDCASMAMENGEQLCLLMLDIDLFKTFNDTHGHQLGDQVLKLVARTLKENVKGRDLAARYGGEEFAVILPMTALADAARLADQIRQSVASKKIVKRSSGEDLGVITLSIGVGQFVYGEPLSAFIERTDGALYAAKQAGRNRVMSQAEVARPAVAVVG